MDATLMPCKTGKQPLTDREKACIMYGYARRMAEEGKEQGLFKDFSVEELIYIFLNP